MPTINAKIIINRSGAKVFEFITDPKEVGKIMPGVIRVSDTSHFFGHRGEKFRWEFLLLGMAYRGTWTVEESQDPLIYVSKTTGGIASRWTYSLVPLAPQRTRLILDVEYQPPHSVIRRYALSFVEPHMHRMADNYVSNLKSLLEFQGSRAKV
ncbi:MAG: SRPBCC family protein [Candidatus Kerfeldbacteria bacterium]|nr:SRPBCC family protein [Candidatus Kerfeldbacteria bacterium]